MPHITQPASVPTGPVGTRHVLLRSFIAKRFGRRPYMALGVVLTTIFALAQHARDLLQ